MLEQEVARKELTAKISKQMMHGDDSLQNLVTHQESLSKAKLTIARSTDELALTKARLDALQALAKSRREILSVNDTLCNSEITLSSAFQNCKKSSLPIESIVFRKNNSHGQSPAGKTTTAFLTTATEENKTTNTKSNVIMVDGDTLKTIENIDIKSLEREIGLGLGLIHQRGTFYEKLLQVPSYTQIQSKLDAEAAAKMASDAALAPVNNQTKAKLDKKMDALESMLRRVNDTNNSPVIRDIRFSLN